MNIPVEIKIYNEAISITDCIEVCNIIETYHNENRFELIKSSNRFISASKNDPRFNPYLKHITNFIEEKHLLETNEVIYLKHFWLSEHGPGPGGPIHIDSEHAPENIDFALSAVAYFNKDFSGGNVRFPKLKYEYSPNTGDIITFPSTGIKSMHQVMPTSNGVRRSVALWFTNIKANRLEFLYGDNQ